MSVPARDPEYDRFGPWVLEIDDDDPVPPLFAGHVSESADVLLSIKVPRKVARRDAVPGMDLYDYVVQLHEETLTIHERVHSTVRSHTVAYREIQHLCISEELLRGGLVLGVPGGAYELPYNTVSSELMRRVAAIIRSRYLAPGETRAHVPAPPDAAKLSFYFERLLKEGREADDRAALLLAQPDIALGSVETSALRRMLFGLVDKRLLESVHLSDGRELRIFDRGRPVLYRWQTTYGHRETVIPVANITSATLEPADHATQTLTVSTVAGEHAWLLGRETAGATAYLEWLAALAARRQG